ncbi:LacI family DNA-binding transcriptional regulator [Streptomyces sp. SBT349]|uniref:LacI family DNA-binding transcriptional regulator n=1 Tax=Streptomyces sp. SBT349 TaxID=1580539 RepID=UPI001F33D98F|nr:LacI family DNA-binding transcriptional regulator [Streptomyces sp. SBT349]
MTIKDVARAAGVHVSTVSRALSAPHLVNSLTRERVLKVATDLGYRPSHTARALTTGRTHNVGLIVADIANPFFPPIIKSAQARARVHGYHVFVADTDENPRAEEELIHTFARQVDGIVLVSPRGTNKAITRVGEELPVVLVNRRLARHSSVLMDIEHGAGRAVGHLGDLGHAHIAVVLGPRGSWTGGRIRAAAEATAADRGLRLDVVAPVPPTAEGGVAAVPGVLDSGATGVVAYNDLVAIGLIEGLAARGAAVPADVSVVGVDDSFAGRLNRPRLTTVAMPGAAAGRAAVDLLIQAIEPPDGSLTTAETMLGTSLIVRDSTAPPNRRPRPE